MPRSSAAGKGSRHPDVRTPVDSCGRAHGDGFYVHRGPGNHVSWVSGMREECWRLRSAAQASKWERVALGVTH